MKRIPTPKNSLTAKMVLAFVLVAVPPMLISGYMIGWLVNKSISHSIERWLYAGQNYVSNIIDDMRMQINTVQKLEALNFGPHSISINLHGLDTMRDLGIDFIILKDEQGEVLYSMPEAVAISQKPVFPGSDFYFVDLSDDRQVLAIVEKTVVSDNSGNLNEFIVGAEFEIDLSMDEAEVMELRIFIPYADNFREIYTSRQEEAFELPPKVVAAINDGADQFYISDRDWLDDDQQTYSILTVFRNDQNAVEGIITFSAITHPFDEWYMNPFIIFWIFVIMGVTISSIVGYVFARKLVNPIRQLSYGTRNVARGNLKYKVPVRGNDEVAALAANFNIMADQLEMARNKVVETNRQERARMLGEIAIGFAHEIRNPLLIIKTSAELACNTLPQNTKAPRILGFVIEEVARIDSLLTEFLTFAKPSPMKFEYLELGPLVQSLLEMSSAEFKKRNIEYSFTDETQLAAHKDEKQSQQTKIIGEYSKIRQVLLNLIINAMDAMPEGGSLDTRIYIPPDDKMLYLDIKDSGKGIPADIQDAIHLPFKSTKPNGQGLGLAVAYAIIEAHEGIIFFKTEPDKGTTFTVGLRR